MRKALLTVSGLLSAVFAAGGLATPSTAFAGPTNLMTSLAKAPSQVITVNHRHYWCCGPGYYPYYPGPAVGYYPPAAYYVPPAAYYPPPVVYYAPPAPRYYGAPADYGPYDGGYVVRRTYGRYYDGW